MDDADYLMALELQNEFDKELNSVNDFDVQPVDEKFFKKRRRSDDEDLDNTCNLVHPEWETLDPTPDVAALFRAFDDKFFQGRLRCVVFEWSKRMYSCAGICYTRRNRLGMAITIRLSEPLLKLRSRKDLVETLLHEMIHAYCSVLGIREGNGGHGPNFRKIMNGINKVAGTNITVYHNFYDEVNVYKTHWWRCNGICQNRKPFYGYVKRTSNTAPGPNNIWWRQHVESCGGTFLKIKEPEKKGPIKKNKTENQTNLGNDLRKFFPAKDKIPGNSSTFTGPIKSNGGGTLILNNKTAKTSTSILQQPSTPIKSTKQFGNLRNVVGLKDLESNENQKPNNAKIIAPPTMGVGYSLTNSYNHSDIINQKVDDTRKVDRDKLRDVWAKKNFSSPSSQTSFNTETKEDNSCKDPKRLRLSEEPEIVSCDLESKEENHWKIVDDEIMIKEYTNPIIDISSDDDDPENYNDHAADKPKTKVIRSADERQKLIRQEILDSSDTENFEDEIELVDDEYDDALVNATGELTDTSLVDDLFGDDTLLKEFKKENAVLSANSIYCSDSKNDIISCPVCQEKVMREQFSDHLDGCVGITVKINPIPSTSKGKKVIPFYKKQPKKKMTSDDEIAKTLKTAGYESGDLESIFESGSSSSTSEDGKKRREGLDNSTHACPVCAKEVDVDKINEHLDICLKE